MNVLVLDDDSESLYLLMNYFQQLDIQANFFSTVDDLLIWLSENNTIYISFIFIGVSSKNESGFYESVKIKSLLKCSHSVSIIFLLSEHIDQYYIKSLKYGHGYLLKPFSCDFLLSSIHYHIKHSQLNGVLAKKNEQLLAYQDIVKKEHDIVETIFANHFEHHLLESDHVKFYISPASVFNGDVLLTAKGPSGSLYLAVGDVTGHGLPAAIGAMPAYAIFRTMAHKDKPVGSIAAEMNKVLTPLLPDNMMMALTLMELDYTKGRAYIWSGGMPEIILIDRFGKIVQKIISRHAPLTVLPEIKFRKDVDVINLRSGDQLYFYTDGIEEARNKDDEMFGSERFYRFFQGDPSRIFNRVIEGHNDYTQGSVQDDDITLVEVLYQDNIQLVEPEIIEKSVSVMSIPWRMEFSLTPSELKHTDPVAQIINFLDSAVDINVHQDCISTVVAELYNNALEHGLLKLDSQSKESEEGFFEYFIERKKKIMELEQGLINVVMEYSIDSETNDGRLQITMTDSGDGFDTTVLDKGVGDEKVYGRGIRLVRELCQDVAFANRGRTVSASYNVERHHTVM